MSSKKAMRPPKGMPTLDRQDLLKDAEMVAWRLDLSSGRIDCSPELEVLGSFAEILCSSLAALLQTMTAADAYIFSKTFNGSAEDLDARVRMCEVSLRHESHEIRLRFVARLNLESENGSRIFEGVLVPAHHWLANPTIESNDSVLSKIFSDNPIASLMTDAHGILLQANVAFESLFDLRGRQIAIGIGRYNLLLDKNVRLSDVAINALRSVYEQGESQSFDFSYDLTALKKRKVSDQKKKYLRASLLPIKDREGVIERVLIQFQDLSSEHDSLQILLKQQRELQESEASYKAFIANSSEAIWCYDMVPPIQEDFDIDLQAELIAKHASLSDGNKVFVTMMRAESLKQLLGMGLTESGSTRYEFDLHEFIRANYQLVDHDIVRRDSRGREYYFQISCVGILEAGRLVRVWGTTKDITARKRYELKLEHISMHDSLTELPNRNHLLREMQERLNRGDNSLSALMLIDLDRFKEINDTLGHQVGDKLLQLIGPRIQSVMTQVQGVVARMGGDEFAIFIPNLESQQQAITFAISVLTALRQEFNLDVICAEISASIGIAIAPDQANDVSTLMRYADVAMYHAKEHMLGVAAYRQDIDTHSSKRLAMMSELGRAIREDQLFLHYQPKVNLATKACYGFEALLRWNHPEMGFVPPGDFIPIAEMTSLIHPLTAWVLEKSVAQCSLWHAQNFRVSIAVNLSARNLLDENIPRLVAQLLAKYQLPADALELEITESSIMSDPARALSVLKQLHQLGVQLSIDDFGTGYSSLAYLKKLPVQTLKIDFSFIRNMLNDQQDEFIVDSTIHLAHGLQLKVVAEGVENQALLDRLVEMGCDEAQGYHIGRPMAIAQAQTWILESSWVRPETNG